MSPLVRIALLLGHPDPPVAPGQFFAEPVHEADMLSTCLKDLFVAHEPLLLVVSECDLCR